MTPRELQEKIAEAYRRFDALNAEDPRTLEVDGAPRARELVQADRLEAWIARLYPDASLPLRLAARSQHLARFRIPRDEYPRDRPGYLRWRRDLAKLHADLAGEVCVALGFDEETRAAVRRIHLKQGIKQDADVQRMEDALCLAFLEHEFVPFIEDYDDEKIVDIVQKTWAKMSPEAHAVALTLPLSGRALALVKRALGA